MHGAEAISSDKDRALPCSPSSRSRMCHGWTASWCCRRPIDLCGRSDEAPTRGARPVARTVVAMSGGVDSSVAAALLAEDGRDLVGVSLQTYDHAPDRGYGRCCSPDDFRDARRVAGRLGIPYYVFDEEASFGRAVIDPFVESYRRGQTPSPCILCNSEVKFGSLLCKAREL